MVALINQTVQGEQLFLFRPGGSGSGFEFNPYRVVRFKNSTEFALEPGPIAIYSKGSFVGEGLSELVASNAVATIPFAVEPRIIVRSREEYSDEEIRLVKIVRGVLEIETFIKYSTAWSVKGMTTREGYKVLVRHPRRGGKFKLVKPAEKVEELPDAYLVPVVVPPGKSEAEVEVVEQTPARSTITIWDLRAPELLSLLLHMPKLNAASRARLEPVVELRQKIGRIDTEVEGLRQQQGELDQRAEQTRENLQAIKRDPLAAELRARLSQRLEQFTSEADRLGRRIVELESRRLEHKIDLEDRLRDLTIEAE
jgi:outer membrane murein-binding lipoprotein Lpp